MIGAIILGIVAGFIARALMPGRDPMGFLLTMAIGIVSLLVAGLISSGWVAFAIGIVIAIILVALVSRWHGGDRHRLQRA